MKIVGGFILLPLKDRPGWSMPVNLTHIVSVQDEVVRYDTKGNSETCLFVFLSDGRKLAVVSSAAQFWSALEAGQAGVYAQLGAIARSGV